MKKTIQYLALLLAMLIIVTFAATAVSASPDGSTPDEAGTSDYSDDYNETDGDSDSDSDSGNTSYDYPAYPGDYDPDYDGSGDAGSVKDSNKITDVKEKDKDNIAPVTWTGITITEEAKEQKGNADISFGVIKDNDATDPDDGGWLLWIGYGLIALALLLILYFVISTVNAKKQSERDRRHGSGGPGSSGGSRASERPVDRASDKRSGGHYADGYEASPRRSSKADTGEIYVPRRATK